MASVAISDWREEVNKYAKGVDNATYYALLDDEIKEVLRDFCEHTHLLTQTIDPFINVVADQSEYQLYPLIDVTDGTVDIEIVESVEYKEDGFDLDQFKPLFPFTAWVKDDAGLGNIARPNAAFSGSWRYQEAPVPTHFHVDNEKVLHLYPIPTVKSDEGLRVTLVLKPDDAATDVAEWIWRDWKKAIAWGTAGRLLGMTTQKWFDRDLGDYYWAKYLDRRSQAHLKKTTGYTRRDTKVQIPDYGGSRARSWVF